jgi:hypothetical protein
MYNYSDEVWQDLSEEAKDLISGLLTSVDKRLSA